MTGHDIPHSATPADDSFRPPWNDESAIDLFGPLLEELMADEDLLPPLQLNLLQQLVELAQDLDDVCARLSSRPLNASQRKALAGIELLAGSLTLKANDFIALFHVQG